MLPPAGRQRRRRAEAAHLDVHRQPEAHETPFTAPGVALCLESIPISRLERSVECLFVVAGVVDSTHLRGERELRRRNEVSSTYLRRVHVQFAREHVHCPFDEICGFRASGAAVRVGRGLVGEHLGQGCPNRRNVVRRVRHHHGERRDGGREQHVVSADIGDEPHLQAQHSSIAPRGYVDVRDDVASVRRSDETFRPIFNPLHRQL